MDETRYTVVEKAEKEHPQGNRHTEIWLRDSGGGFSLLRVPVEVGQQVSLGDEVTLSITCSRTAKHNSLPQTLPEAAINAAAN